jgi:Holliday junction resolvasome RuvABC endonuclease subunit
MTKLLTLDPSSKIIGYALTTGPTELIEAGRITPAKPSAKWPARVESLQVQTLELLAEVEPDLVLMEAPSGKVHAAIADKSKGAGQSIYGAAFGVIWAAMRQAMPPNKVEIVSANVWTRQKKKEKRAEQLQRIMPGLDLKQDTGLDAADAIELAIWWWAQKQISGKNAG